MPLRWDATQYRKHKEDEYVDVRGFGRFRVLYVKSDKGYRLQQNGQNIGSIHPTAAAAKAAAEGIVDAATNQ